MDNKGFTLIELLAVMIILAVLTAVAVPKFIDLQSGAERKLIMSVLAEFNTQEHMAYLDNRLSLDPVDPYPAPITVPSELSYGMTLTPEGKGVLVFTGGGSYKVYRCEVVNSAANWQEDKCKKPKPPKKDKPPKKKK